MTQIVLIAHNLRSSHNVGSLLRSADGLGVKKVYLTGYSPYPHSKNDKRLPHLINKISKQIHKTALGAEDYVDWEHDDNVLSVLRQLNSSGYELCALEQNHKSVVLSDYRPGQKIALVVGREVEGLETEVLQACDKIIEIPMLGKKESFNVTQAAVMALYHIVYNVK